MIRAAKHEDIPRLVELGAIMHATTSFSHLDYSPERTGDFLRTLIDGAGVVFAAEVNGEVVGGMPGAVTEQWFNHDLVAYEYCLFVEPGKRQGIIAMRLLLAFQEWAKIKGAKEIHLGITTGVNVEGTARLYSRMGYKYAGPIMKLEL